MIPTWRIDYVESGLPTRTCFEGGNSEAQAKQLFLEAHPKAIKVRVRPGAPKVESYEELVLWLREHCISPQEARTAAQIQVLNLRNTKPHRCPVCNCDLNKRLPDKIGNGYYCPACKQTLQIG
jgi:hypothetical protein